VGRGDLIERLQRLVARARRPAVRATFVGVYPGRDAGLRRRPPPAPGRRRRADAHDLRRGSTRAGRRSSAATCCSPSPTGSPTSSGWRRPGWRSPASASSPRSAPGWRSPRSIRGARGAGEHRPERAFEYRHVPDPVHVETAAPRRRTRPRRQGARRVPGGTMNIRDMNWMQVEAYLQTDDRCVLPLGSVEQHGYMSLCVDQLLAERVAPGGRGAARRAGVPGAALRPGALLPGLPRQHDAARRHLRARRARAARRHPARRLPARADRQRPRRQPAGGGAGDRVRHGPPRDARQVPQLVGGAGRWARCGRRRRTRRTPRGWRTSPGRGCPACRCRPRTKPPLDMDLLRVLPPPRSAPTSATATTAAPTRSRTPTCCGSGRSRSRRRGPCSRGWDR
jgi:hypothetical protein